MPTEGSGTPASRWQPVAAYAAVSATNQMLWLTYAPLTTDAARHYRVSVGAIGWLAQLFPLLFVVLSVPAGRVLDRWLRPGLAAGGVLTAVGAVLRLAGGYEAALAGQIVVAVAQPLVLNSVTKLSGAYLRPSDRTTGIAVSSAGVFAGMVAALLVGAVLGGHRFALLLALQAGLSLAAAVWLCAALRAPIRFRSGQAVVASLRGVGNDTVVRLLCLLVLAGFGVFVALTTWLQALLEPAGVTEGTAGVLLLVMVVSGVIGSAVLPEPVARHRREVTFLVGSVTASAAACTALAVLPGTTTALVAMPVVGLLLLADLPVVLELAERRTGPAGGTASALLWLAGNLGGLLVAVVVSSLVHHPAVAFLLLSACLLGLLPALPPLARELRPPQVQETGPR